MRNPGSFLSGHLTRLATQVGVAALLLGFAGVALAQAETDASAKPKGWEHHCPDVDANQQALIDLWGKAHTLALGEVHGSAEAPAFTYQALCAALRAGGPAVLGLEMFASEQARVDAYIGSSGDADAKAKLLAGPFWTRSYQDGRSSVAMLELIESTRMLTAAGAPVRVLCFDDPKRAGATDRDHGMALSILADHAATPESRRVLLMGNLHANVEVGTPFDPKLKPTAWHLDQALENVMALKGRNAAGTFWLCNNKCGIVRVGGRGKPEKRGEVLLFPKRGAGLDGIFDLGTTTASPPAVRP